MSGLPDPSTTRVLLIGADKFDHLDDLPAARTNVDRLVKVFTGEVWDLAPAHCTPLLNPATSYAVESAVDQALNDGDTVLLYYVGHGVVEDENHGLCLALPQSKANFYNSTAGPYKWIQRRVARATASRVIVILDCCFSARAMQAGSTPSSNVAALADDQGVEGIYLMAAAAENAVALAPPGAQFTAFTGAWIDVLTRGVPNGPKYLTLDTVFDTLKTSLTGAGMPVPVPLDRNQLGRVPFCRNLAHTPVRTDLSLLQEAEEEEPAEHEIRHLAEQLSIMRRAQRWEEYRHLVRELAGTQVSAHKQAELISVLEEDTRDPAHDMAHDLASAIGTNKQYQLLPDVVLALDRADAESWNVLLRAAGRGYHTAVLDWLADSLPEARYGGAMYHLFDGAAGHEAPALWAHAQWSLFKRNKGMMASFLKETADQQTIEGLATCVIKLRANDYDGRQFHSTLIDAVATRRPALDVVALVGALKQLQGEGSEDADALVRSAAVHRELDEARDFVGALRGARMEAEVARALGVMAVDTTVPDRIEAFRAAGQDEDADEIIRLLGRHGAPDIFVMSLQEFERRDLPQERQRLMRSVHGWRRRARLARPMRRAGLQDYWLTAMWPRRR